MTHIRMARNVFVATLGLLMSTSLLAQDIPSTKPEGATKALVGTAADINGKFKVSVPVPGKPRDSVFTLNTVGDTLSGSMTDPHQPEQTSTIYNTNVEGNQFSFTARIGNVEFNFLGTAGAGKLAMTMTSTEVVKLAPGSKIKTAQDAPVDGAYLVAVHAPNNSTMDNIFFLNSRGSTLNGKMVRIGGVKDSADFFDGTVTGNKVSFYAKNPMSTFHFDGTADNGVLDLTMTVTDTRYAVEGVKL